MTEMELRAADRPEAAAVVTLINRAFEVEKFFVDGDRIDLPQVLERFERGEFLVAAENGELAGVVYIEPQGERTYLGLLSIQPARQGSGLGRRLVEFAEHRARQNGSKTMYLHVVNVRLELPGFYKRLGYAETGSAPFPPDTPTKLPCHMVIMSKPL